MTDNIIFDDLRQKKRYDVCYSSHIGRREEQQDSGYLAVNDNEVVAVLCDGMGGIEGGRIASRVAVDKFVECYGQSNGQAWMETAADIVDDMVFALKNSEGQRLGAGTTLVAVNVDDSMMSWVSVGDSRVYIIRDEEILQVTTDHNYYLQLNHQLNTGEINKSQYYLECEDGEALISFIGMGGLVLKDVSNEPLNLLRGDTILLCTDGIYRTLSDEIILASIIRNSTAEEIIGEIDSSIMIADKKYQDNYSAIVIRIN